MGGYMHILFLEYLKKYGFNSAIKWTGLDSAEFEYGVGSWADNSKQFKFNKGKGQPGRVLESQCYEWCVNIQESSTDKFTR